MSVKGALRIDLNDCSAFFCFNMRGKKLYPLAYRGINRKFSRNLLAHRHTHGIQHEFHRILVLSMFPGLIVVTILNELISEVEVLFVCQGRQVVAEVTRRANAKLLKHFNQFI
jgi:hypothetical protein